MLHIRAPPEDREFCDRWLFNNQRMVYAPVAIVRHAHDLSLYEFLQQHLYYGRGAVGFERSERDGNIAQFD